MRWDASEIARFARAAGFHGDRETEAVAVALATSGGVAEYDFTAGPPGTGRWQGLWGVDVDRWPEYADRDLYVPQRAAQAAYDLHERYDGWTWSPTYIAGNQTHYLAHAGTERTRYTATQAPAVPFTAHHADRLFREIGDDHARRRANILTYHHPGVM